MSKWLRDQIVTPRDFATFDKRLRAFFLSMEAHKFTPKVKQLEQLTVALDDEDMNTTKSTNAGG